jgi:SAM-dependent methyltransferase
MRSDARDGREETASPHPVRCGSCGLVFIDPIPAAAVDPKTYGSEYYEPWRHPREERARSALWSRRLHQVGRRAQVSTLLDVGCGDGLFLQIARDSGWVVEGIEYSPEGARHAADRLGRPIALGDLSRENLLRGPFEVITLWHVLEHLPEAGAMLQAARRRMAPGGLLVVAVPNLDNLLMRAAYRLARFRSLPLFEEGAREPHLNHFDAATLTRALVRYEFSDIDIRPDRCALTPAKRAIDAAAAIASRISHRLLTDAIVAYARAPR